MATLTRDEIDGMKVADLKKELSDRGLSTTGKKADLAQRLTEFFGASSGEAPSAGEDAQQPPVESMEVEEETAAVGGGGAGGNADEATAAPAQPQEEAAPPAETSNDASAVDAAAAAAAAAAEEEGLALARAKALALAMAQSVAEERQREEAEAAEQAAAAQAAQQQEADAEGEEEDGEEEEEEGTSGKRETGKRNDKNRKKKDKKKKAKAKQQQQQQSTQPTQATAGQDGTSDAAKHVEIEYVTDDSLANLSDPSLSDFAAIFERFKPAEAPAVEDEAKKKKDEEEAKRIEADLNPKDHMKEDSDDEGNGKGSDSEGEGKKATISKRQSKKLNRLSVAQLKQLVARPDVVEMHDVTSADPVLLVHLKGCRNTVPVPRHWAHKRKYLQGKRGIEKPPFQLPDFIRRTGITEMREALAEKEKAQGLRGEMRNRARPKMGKLEIDYQKLHDAFFRWQTKPRMTIHGDLYFEGKENTPRVSHRKPGDLSVELRVALGMPATPDALPIPPPWLLHQQRYGPPPSYPRQRIPGVNAPLPAGASWGYHAGGWGKAPVDERGRPLYGDVFGSGGMGVEEVDEAAALAEDPTVIKTLWGQLESDQSDSEEEEEEEEEEGEGEKGEKGSGSEEEEEAGGLATPSGITSEAPSGISSIATSGMETPEAIELRKRKQAIEAVMDDNEEKTLYKVIPQKETRVGGAMMGSSYVYDLKASAPVASGGAMAARAAGDVEIALENPEDLANLDQQSLQAKYDEVRNGAETEDFSDMIAEHSARSQLKRKKADEKKDSSKDKDKTKKFKF